jgi:hypothetical protein
VISGVTVAQAPDELPPEVIIVVGHVPPAARRRLRTTDQIESPVRGIGGTTDPDLQP